MKATWYYFCISLCSLQSQITAKFILIDTIQDLCPLNIFNLQNILKYQATKRSIQDWIISSNLSSIFRKNPAITIVTFYGSVWWRYPALKTFANSKHFCLPVNSDVIQQLDYSFASLNLRFAFLGLIETFYVNYPWFNFKATLVLSPNMQTYIIYVNS